jgi:triosephosphate isomerase (TIM)
MIHRFIVGNWKMHNTVPQSEALAREIITGYHPHPSVEVAVAPSFVALHAVGQLLHSTPIRLAAQTVYQKGEGAYTGEISPLMLKAVGCDYVIIGHSERRHILGETNQDVNEKVQCALRFNLRPIVCVGERLEERESGDTMNVIERQLREGLSGLDASEAPHLTIAYEPVWAIGTGRAATVAQAEEVHGNIRNLLKNLWREAAERVRILYGGSVSPDNAGELFRCQEINGALIGKACLNAESFARIISLANP